MNLQGIVGIFFLTGLAWLIRPYLGQLTRSELLKKEHELEDNREC